MRSNGATSYNFSESPFLGSLLVVRRFSGEKYRFGFNGKENDDEVKGAGGQQDYGLRIYDTRICKFLSVDPLAKDFPWYTPYQFAGNKPIQYTDLDGAEEKATSGKNSEQTSSGYTNAQDGAVAGYNTKSVEAVLNVPKPEPNPIQIPRNNAIIYASPSNLERWCGVIIAPETETTVKYDYFNRAVATGGALVIGGITVSEVAPIIKDAAIAAKDPLLNGAARTVLKVEQYGFSAYNTYQNSRLVAGGVGFAYGYITAAIPGGSGPDMPNLDNPYGELGNQMGSAYKQNKDVYIQSQQKPSAQSYPAQNNHRAISNSYSSNTSSNGSGTYIKRRQKTPLSTIAFSWGN